MHDIGEISHVIKHSHRSAVGAFDRIYTKALFGLDPDLFYLLYSRNKNFSLYIMDLFDKNI